MLFEIDGLIVEDKWLGDHRIAGAAVGGIAVAATRPLPGPPATETITTQVTETKPIVTIGDINALRAALWRDGFIVQEGEFSHQDEMRTQK